MQSKQPYPINLAIAVLCEENIPEQFPEDLCLGMEYVLKTLTPQETEVLKGKYQNSQTNQQIATAMNLSRERIRQIHDKGLRKLRYPNRSIYIRYGLSAALKKEKQREREQFESAKKLAYDEGYEKGYADACRQNSVSFEELSEQTQNFALWSLPIEKLDLSVRSFNALRRTGVYTIRDLAKLTFSEVTKIRNIGVASIREIGDQMAKFGIAFAPEKEEISQQEK